MVPRALVAGDGAHARCQDKLHEQAEKTKQRMHEAGEEAKGVGELGLCGVAAAVANAVYNATGVRVRHYPITLDKFLDRLPQVA